MALREELCKQGSWLFRWRSYLPLLLLPLLILGLGNSEVLGETAGDVADGFWEVFCVVLSFLGLGIRCLTIGYVPKGTSGRNTRAQKASTLNTTGMYSVVRNPLYLGNFMVTLGIILFAEPWLYFLIAVLAFWFYYERIVFAEEEFLRSEFGPPFLEWAEKTPAFLPRLKNWQQGDLSFSFRNVLKREYTGFLGIIASFTFLKIAGALFSEGKLQLDRAWATFFIIGLVIYLTLRTLRKKTSMLDVAGR
ncbi:MAG: isoprenylcysteine carboxylmethyltransferase family protein [Candidatus Latescibacterota bacterium]